MVKLSRKSSVIPTSSKANPIDSEYSNDTRMTGMRSNDRNEIKKYPIFTRHLRWRNELQMTEIVILTSFLSSQHNIIPRHSYDQMTIEWTEWHPNDSILSSWTMIAGMTLKWKNDTQMVEWHSNDGMTAEWCFKVEMS